jgi:hypothetical protein
MFQYSMNLAYRDAKFADLEEQTLYNAILGDIDLDGTHFTYTNALDERGLRTLWHTCPCCVGNIPRILLQLPTWMYAKDATSLYINQFIGSAVNVGTIAGANVQVIQTTDYPWSGNVSMTINPAQPQTFAIRIRVPNRDTSALYISQPPANGITTLSVNGTAITPTIENGYVVLTRTWSPGDKIDLTLPMQVQRITAINKVTADRGRVALRYGPLIYNIENTDQDLGESLPAASPLSTDWRPDFLHGVRVITGQFTDGSSMLAIPNYARNNRGDRTMESIVWVKGE